MRTKAAPKANADGSSLVKKLPLWQWMTPTSAVYHPDGKRTLVICDACGKRLSTAPESIDPPPAYSEDEVNGVSVYFCKRCTEKLETALSKQTTIADPR